MEFSIIIVNWKSASFLAACLDSIVDNPPGVDWECIVVDNASYDGAAELCKIKYPFVKFIQSDKNCGFAGASNRGAAGASGDNFLFLNPDTIVRPGSLQALYDGLMSGPDIGAAGPRLLNKDGTLQTTCVLPFPTILTELLDNERLRRRTAFLSFWGTSALYNGGEAPQEVAALSGASLMVRRSWFEKTGGFSTDYFMYAEDIDLCTKIRRAGGSVCYVPGAEIVHLGGGSSQSNEKTFQSALLIKESNRILLKKFKGPFYAALYQFSMGCGAALRLLLLFLLPSKPSASLKNARKKWSAILQWSAGSRKHIVSVDKKEP